MKTKEIKLKIKSTVGIKKITKTMEMVSVSKMKRSVAKALASRAYSKYALELLVNLSKDKEVTNPLMLVPRSFSGVGMPGKELIIVIASNTGLCGGYHSNLTKALSHYLSAKGGSASGGKKEIKAITIGKHAEKICKKLGVPLFASFITFSEHSELKQTKELSDLVVAEYKTGEYASVKILFTEYLKSTTYKPVMRELFPISVETVKNVVEIEGNLNTETQKETFVDYKFEPDLETILESVLPGLVDVVVYQTLAEAYASEHSARMFAMKNAGDSATTILDALTLAYNHARQDGITRELSEIVAGAEALNVN